MIVYGDPCYETSLRALLERLRAHLSALRDTRPALDELRALLIEAGQLEQAAQDGFTAQPNDFPLSQCRAITDCAATAFLQCWREAQNEISSSRADVAAALAQMACLADGLPREEWPLTVKLPEGFAFYALYPEQYGLSARRWLAVHAAATPRRAIVVGVRSIGTTLPAVVNATLAAAGWQTQRVTVRPTGPPFERVVRLDAGELDGAEWALIVDEGPGLSGSSLAATAQACCDAGLARERLSFFPAHDHEPGSAAAEITRRWWAGTPRYVTPLAQLRWQGRSLAQLLADRTAALCGEPAERVEDLSGGLWRRFLYANSDDWPVSALPFERLKYRCTVRGGAAVLWKFSGLAAPPGDAGDGAGAMRAELARRAADPTVAIQTPSPLGTAQGFLALPWVEGEPLTRDAATPALLAGIGRHIVAVAGWPPTRAEREQAVQRLDGVLCANTEEALGAEYSERTQRNSAAARQWARETSLLAYGDGRMAPHEWIRARDGRIWKVDGCGHDWDHTAIGTQSLLWDVAGAITEWNLNEATAAPLLAALRDAGLTILPAALNFYGLAYAAFRMGQCALCAQLSADNAAEASRLLRARDFYCAALEIKSLSE
jgi:hypothetical protein